jgi:hypothetical protein
MPPISDGEVKLRHLNKRTGMTDYGIFLYSELEE